jgi:hypothetical protein
MLDKLGGYKGGMLTTVRVCCLATCWMTRKPVLLRSHAFVVAGNCSRNKARGGITASLFMLNCGLLFCVLHTSVARFHAPLRCRLSRS